jgi:deoxyribonuclease-4
MKTGLLLGSHMSVRGGLHTAFARGEQIGCTTMQIFTKNGSQWEGKPIFDADILSYKTARAKATIDPVVAHAAYLINLCASNPGILRRSRRAFEDELRRCEALGLRGLVFHPGAHMGQGESDGIRRIAESINTVHARTPAFQTLTILETTAGQGSAIGYRFEHLRSIIDGVEQKGRIAICIDTCHLFAAGYPVHTGRGWEETIREFDSVVGLKRLAVVHVNDSKKDFGSRVDRHDHIGKGQIGKEGFRRLMNDSRFAAIPKILETVLRSLVDSTVTDRRPTDRPPQ